MKLNVREEFKKAKEEMHVDNIIKPRMISPINNIYISWAVYAVTLMFLCFYKNSHINWIFPIIFWGTAIVVLIIINDDKTDDRAALFGAGLLLALVITIIISFGIYSRTSGLIQEINSTESITNISAEQLTNAQYCAENPGDAEICECKKYHCNRTGISCKEDDVACVLAVPKE